MERNEIWVDSGQYDEITSVGTMNMFFLIKNSHVIKGWESFAMSNRPPYTNVSNEPRPIGWCGTWNDVSTHGEGVWSLVRIAKNGRNLIRRVTDPQLISAFLDQVGYPELHDDLTRDTK